MTTIAMYPGTFDPMTNGHIDLIARASKLFDKVIVAIAINSGKTPLFSLRNRVILAKKSLTNWTNIEVCDFDNLLIKIAEQKNADVIIKGLRTISDFEYESQLVGMNRKMGHGLETLFLMATEKFSYISASLVRETAT